MLADNHSARYITAIHVLHTGSHCCCLLARWHAIRPGWLLTCDCQPRTKVVPTKRQSPLPHLCAGRGGLPRVAGDAGRPLAWRVPHPLSERWQHASGYTDGREVPAGAWSIQHAPAGGLRAASPGGVKWVGDRGSSVDHVQHQLRRAGACISRRRTCQHTHEEIHPRPSSCLPALHTAQPGPCRRACA